MKQSKLEVLFDYLPKSKIKAGEGLEEGNYPFYTSSENQTKFLNQYQHEAGCLVFGTGGKASVHLTTHKFSTSTDCIIIRPKTNEKVDVGYVYQYFKSNMHVLENGFKGAGLKHISKTYLSEVQIPHPEEINDQKRIAHLLDKVDGLISQRKQHLQQLDNLLKSVFIEMFGPHSLGYADWPIAEIKDLAANHKGSMRTGPFGSNLLHSEFNAEGDVAVLGIDNAVQNRFAWDERRFITNEKYKELVNYRIFPGDVIVTIMGTIGRSAVVPDDIPLAINTKHLAAITLNREFANPLFISYSIHSNPFILKQFMNKNRGAIMSGLNLGIIKETKLKRPPIELQNKFAVTHMSVNKLKTTYSDSLIELEILYRSLSQKAFKGELDLSRVSLPSPSLESLREQSKKQLEKMKELFANEFSMSSPNQRIRYLKKIFDDMITKFKVNDLGTIDEKFWGEVELDSLDYMDDDGENKPDKFFTPDEYDQFKQWVFEAIQSGKLTQQHDEDNTNRIILKTQGT